jgi:hypothetical protein
MTRGPLLDRRCVLTDRLGCELQMPEHANPPQGKCRRPVLSFAPSKRGGHVAFLENRTVLLLIALGALMVLGVVIAIVGLLTHAVKKRRD